MWRNFSTGCLQKTVTSNISLTDLKITKNGVTQSFLESLYPTIYASSTCFMFKWPKMAQSGRNSKSGPKWHKVAQSGPKWPKVAQSGPKWPKVVQSGPNSKNGPKWPKVIQSGPKWPKVAQSGHFGPLWLFGPLWATLGHFGPLWITLGHFGPFWLFGPLWAKVA